GGGGGRRRRGGRFRCHGLPECGAGRVASRLGLGGSAGGGRGLHRTDIGLFLSGDDAGGVDPGGTGGVGPETGLGADLVVADPATSRAVATIVGGRVAHLTAAGSGRLSAAG